MRFLNLFLSVLFLFTISQAQAQVEYSVQFDPNTDVYTVYMRSSVPYSGNFALIATAQATLVVPHGVGGGRFELTKPSDDSPGVDNHQTNMNWSNNARVDAPTENTSADYVSLGFINNPGNPSQQALFDIPADVEIPLFSFKNGGPCLGDILLIVNNVDPFDMLPNSANSNPGNSMTVAGAGGEAYVSNYYNGPTDCNDDDGDGVPNVLDQCPDTPFGDTVDSVGCSLGNCGAVAPSINN